MTEPSVPVTPSEISAAIVYYGSERNAERALGISRGTMHGIMSGRHGPSERTSARFGAQPAGILRALDTLAGLIEGSGTRLSDQKQERFRLGREDKADPGTAREQANIYARVLESRGLDVHGDPIEMSRAYVDRTGRSYERGRRINRRQRLAYEQLVADLDILDAQKYARLIAYQGRPVQPRHGGPSVRIAPL